MKQLFVIFCILLFSFKSDEKLKPYNFKKLGIGFTKMPINEKNRVTEKGVNLGRHLFYDPILSLDSTISCASCHKQEFAFSDGAKKFSTGINNQQQTRNTLPLFNLAWYPKLFWDGRAKSIEKQVAEPILNNKEMGMNWSLLISRLENSKFYKTKFEEAFGNQKIDSSLIVKAIAQFERTLISDNSKYDKVLRGEAKFTKDEYDGFVIANDQSMGDCLHCHPTDANAMGTTFDFSNNGIDNFNNVNQFKDAGLAITTGLDIDFGKFKIPSLRNVALTAPYMHDGRFKTLEQVINFYSDSVNTPINLDSKMQYAHRGGVRLTNAEKQKVFAFLNTLTDSIFIKNEQFSNPYKSN